MALIKVPIKSRDPGMCEMMSKLKVWSSAAKRSAAFWNHHVGLSVAVSIMGITSCFQHRRRISQATPIPDRHCQLSNRSINFDFHTSCTHFPHSFCMAALCHPGFLDWEWTQDNLKAALWLLLYFAPTWGVACPKVSGVLLLARECLSGIFSLISCPAHD